MTNYNENNILDDLLQISRDLFEQLSTIPKFELRDDYIDTLNSQLDKRGEILLLVKELNISFSASNSVHEALLEIDKGIRERLEKVLEDIKIDMKNLQNAKKNERQYMNPYSDVRVMDGMYYDKKK